jgi:di/tricarboxylate transporter
VKVIIGKFITNGIINVLRIMLGIMMVTMFLSMWINNTATCGMMVPIADAMLEELGNHSYTVYPLLPSSLNKKSK